MAASSSPTWSRIKRAGSLLAYGWRDGSPAHLSRATDEPAARRLMRLDLLATFFRLSSRAGVSKAALPTYGSAAFLNTLATNPIHHSRSLVTEPHDGSDEWMNRISCPTLPSFSREHWTSGQAAVTGRRLPLLSSFSLFALSPTRCLLLVDRVFATGSMVFL